MKLVTNGLNSPTRSIGFAMTQVSSVITTVLLRFTAVLGAFFFALAACADISPTAAELEALRIQIAVKPRPELEALYLEVFPKTFKEFEKIFALSFTPDGLYHRELEQTSVEHLELLKKLAWKYPQPVLDLWFSISTNALWDADAVDMLQNQITEYAAQDTKKFALALMAKPDAQRRSIIKFLADVENFDGYPEYATLLSNLEALGQPELRRLFLEAKKQRMKYRHEPGE